MHINDVKMFRINRRERLLYTIGWIEGVSLYATPVISRSEYSKKYNIGRTATWKDLSYLKSLYNIIVVE